VLRGLKLSDGMRWGEVATPHQVQDAAAILDDDPTSPRLHFICRPRGGSKTSDLAAVALTMLLTGRLGPGELAYGFATDKDQARLLVDAMRRIASATGLGPGLVDFGLHSAESPQHGGRIEIQAADAHGAFGLLPSLLIVDELAAWPPVPTHTTTWTAILSSQPKRNCRLVLATSAGSPSHWSHKVLQHAEESPRWRVSSMPGPVPWLSSEALDEQRKLLTPSQFARLHLNVWTEPEERLATSEDVDAAATLDGPVEPLPGRRYVAGLDLGLKRDRSALVVGHLEHPDAVGRPPGAWWSLPKDPFVGDRPPVLVVDLVKHWVPGRLSAVDLGDVEATLLEAWRVFNRPKVAADPWQSAQMSQRLRAAGVAVEDHVFSEGSNSRRASALFALLRDRRLLIPRDGDRPGLETELRRVKLVEKANGAVRVDHDRDGHDDLVQAMGIVAVTLLDRASGGAAVGSAVWSSGRDLGVAAGREWLESARRVGSDGLLRELERAGVVERVSGVPVSVGVLAGGHSRRR